MGSRCTARSSPVIAATRATCWRPTGATGTRASRSGSINCASGATPSSPAACRWEPYWRYISPEVEPYGIKDPAIRAVVLSAMTSGDTTRAGILVTPGEAIYQHCELVDVVKRELNAISTPEVLIKGRAAD